MSLLDTDYLEKLAEDCGIFDDSNFEIAVKNIQSLDERFERDNLVEIYNYFLSVAQNPDILMSIVRCSDRFRDKSSLSPLLDLLLMNNIQSDLRR